MAGNTDDPRDHPEAKRLRILRRALGYANNRGGQGAFAKAMGWGQSEISLWENGHRPIASKKAITAHRAVPGLDPLYLTEGSKAGMSMPLRKAIEQAEAEEEEAERERLSREG